MKIEDIMTRNVVTVEMDDSLAIVQDIFAHTQFHHLLVIENNKLFGVISDRDLFKAISPRLGTMAETEKDKASLNKKAHQIMSRQPVTLHKHDDVNKALQVFHHNAISCIPVINDEGIPEGILSWRDILNLIRQQGLLASR